MHDIQIKTERLLLRPLKIADAEEVFERVSDERVSRYMVYTTYTNDELRHETLLKLFFGNETGMEGAKEHIERFEEKCKGELLILNMLAENLGRHLQDDTHKHYY